MALMEKPLTGPTGHGDNTTERDALRAKLMSLVHSQPIVVLKEYLVGSSLVTPA